MIRKKILVPDRIRQIEGSFGFIPHRFLADGFLATLNQHELLLYLFLVLAADRDCPFIAAIPFVRSLASMSINT